MYIRKTHDEYEVQGMYGSYTARGGFVWERLTTELTYEEAGEMLKCYRENEPRYLHRIKKIRVKNS